MDKKRIIIGILAAAGAVIGFSWWQKHSEDERNNMFDISEAGEKARQMVTDVIGDAGDALDETKDKLLNNEPSDQTKVGLGAVFPPLAAWFGYKKADEGWKAMSPSKQKTIKDVTGSAVFPPLAAWNGLKNYWRGYNSLPVESKTRKVADAAHTGAASVLPPVALVASIKKLFSKPAKPVRTNTKYPGQYVEEGSSIADIIRLQTDRKKKAEKKEHVRGSLGIWEYAAMQRERLAKLAKKKAGKTVTKPIERQPKGGGGLVVSGGVRR